MAITSTLYNQQSYNPYVSYQAAPTPVAIGPVPTPVPPSGVAYTPQYSGGQMFSDPNPTTYTSTPQGAAELTASQTSSGTTPAPAPTQTNNSVDLGNKQSLINALMSKGYSLIDAQNAANGPNADNLAREYLNSGTPSAPAAPVLKSSVIKGTTYSGPTNTDIANQVNPTNDYSNYSSQLDPTEYYNMIDQNYNEKQGLYNSNENALKAAQDAFNKTIEADFTANQGTLNTSKSKTGGQLDQNVVQAEQRKQDALNSAKQLYNQLQTGYRQRFGGASSAGEASQTILGEEQQRQSGQVGRDFQNTASQIESQRVDLENQYNDSMLQLNQQKQKGLADLQSQFVTQLAQINDNRAVSVDAKNQAKLQVLQNMRNQAITIQSQHEQYAQQLEAMKMQQQLQIDTFNQTGGKAVSTANTAVNTLANKTSSTTSQIGMSGQPKTVQTLQSPVTNAVGQIDPKNGFTSTKNWWEQ